MELGDDETVFMRRTPCRGERVSQALAIIGVGLAIGELAIPVASAAPSAQSQVARLAAQLQAAEQQSEALGQRYDAAIQAQQDAQRSIAADQAKITTLKANIARIKTSMRHSAITAYVVNSNAMAGLSLFATSATQSDAQKLYREDVIGNLSKKAEHLKNAQAALNGTIAREQLTAQQAQQQAATAASLVAQNQRIQASAQASLASAKAEVARQAQAAAEAAASHPPVTTPPSSGGSHPPTTIPTTTPTTSPSSGGGGTPSPSAPAAVRAALSQIGVSYLWGGESPGVGFDCSGLTQWAWGQAGVGIPRTAAGQWYGLPHVSLNALQPGDLLIYFNLDNDKSVDHVTMYVGGGMTVAAAHSGTRISEAPMFSYGLIGAVRP